MRTCLILDLFPAVVAENDWLPCGFPSMIPLPHLSTLYSRSGLEFDLEGGRIEIRLAERLPRFGLNDTSEFESGGPDLQLKEWPQGKLVGPFYLRSTVDLFVL